MSPNEAELNSDSANAGEPAAEVVAALLDGPIHRFDAALGPQVPTAGAGVYTIWDEDERLVFTPQAAEPDCVR